MEVARSAQTTDHQVIADIDLAFGQVGKPSRFLPDVGDPEFNDHEELLQSHTRTTIRRSDVRGGYDPICSCEPQGVAYYFPSLARFALEEPGDPMDWYAAQLLFHLTYQGSENRFLDYCDADQRHAVAQLIEHLILSKAKLLEESYTGEDASEGLSLWRKAKA